MRHIHRFFVSQPLIAGLRVPLAAEDSFHAGRVLRLRQGDAVELAGGDGRVFTARIVISNGRDVQAEALAEIEDSRPDVALTVAQALPQGRKLDLVVEKLSEIGVSRLSPFFAEKSAPKPGRESVQKLARWRRIARAAAEQARRSRVMDVDAPVELPEWLASFTGGIVVLSTEVVAEPLWRAAKAAPAPLALMVGPESGFSEDEIGLLGSAGACFARLGKNVLRTETAALVAASILLHRMGELG